MAKYSSVEKSLEARLLAPCCWSQTLDVHESPLADRLRAEIRVRLTKKEAAADIEDDLARRYGDRIRAMPKGREPFLIVPLVVGVLMVFGALGIVLFAMHSVRAQKVRDLNRTNLNPQRVQNPNADKYYTGELERALKEFEK